MNKKNIIPQATKPVVRVTQGTQIDLLAELSEEVLGGTPGCVPSSACGNCGCGCGCCGCGGSCVCSYDDDNA